MKLALEEETSHESGIIDILTDARHGWRKNSKHTDVVCLGNLTKKVLDIETITHQDDPIAQRHEKIGTERIYDTLRPQVQIRRHCHDSNNQITKYVREKQPDVQNTLDNWHGLKSLEKNISEASHGPKKFHGVKWHKELSDKVKGIRTHCIYALRNCENNPDRLRELLLIPVTHYQDNHQHCLPHSRCRSDDNYELSKIELTDGSGINILRNAITSARLYKQADLYCSNMSTAHVESFNNTLNVFQDKRIAFGDQNYRLRTLLAVCHWNENISSRTRTERSDSRGRVFYELGKATHQYREKIWAAFLLASSH